MEQNIIISITLNFLLLGMFAIVAKEFGFKIKRMLFKRGFIIREIDGKRQIYEHYISKKIENDTVNIGKKKKFILNSQQVYFKKRIPVYTYVKNNATPHDYLDVNSKIASKLNAEIFKDTIIMAETSGGDILKKLFQYRYVFLLVAGIAIGVAVVLVLVFQLNNWTTTVQVCQAGEALTV